MDTTTTFDVIVIGAGPVGTLAAADLANRGLTVALVERHAEAYHLPRAGHVDGEVMRILQGLDAHTRVLEDATPYGDYTWYNASGEVMFVIDFAARSPHFWFTDYTIYQPVVEQSLLASLESTGLVTLFYGHEAESFEQDADGVTVATARVGRDEDGSRVRLETSSTLRASYVIAADGANSATREHLGIQRTDAGFEERWLILDARIRERWDGESHGAQYCDPRRPAFETPLGRNHHRWEWALLPGETTEDFLDPQRGYELLAERGIGPEHVDVVRQQVYTFGSRTAETWSQGRIFLAGDAAHTMPPFMGQGMCSGLRDAANLAWKIQSVLTGAADPRVLDSYEAERRPHTQTWADISLAVGRISCTTDPEAARVRDERFARGERLDVPAFPHIMAGLLHDDDSSPLTVGRAFPQALVASEGRLALLDDITGAEWACVVAGPRAVVIPDAVRDVMAAAGMTIVEFGSPGLVDVDGSYYRYFAEHDAGLALVRPDHVVYGTSQNPAGLLELLAALRADGIRV